MIDEETSIHPRSDETIRLDAGRNGTTTVIRFEVTSDENVDWMEAIGWTEARAYPGRHDLTAKLVIAGKFEEHLDAGRLEFHYLGRVFRARIVHRWIERYQPQAWQIIGLPDGPGALRLPRFTTHFELRFIVEAGRREYEFG